MRTTKAMKRSGNSLLVGLFLWLCVIASKPNAADNAKAAIGAHMDSLVALVDGLTKDAKTRSSNLRETTAYFKSLMKRHNELHDVLRINSRGKVTNEIARDGKVGKRYRSVARQRWFTDVVGQLEPYYGKVKTRRGQYMLFWAVPMLSKDSKRAVGAVLVKLDVDKCLEGAGERYGKPMSVSYEGRALFSRQWDKKTGEVQRATVDIPGMEGLTVSSIGDAKPVAAKVEKPAAQAKKTQPAAEKPKETKETEVLGPEKEKKGPGIGWFVFPVLILIAIGLGVYLSLLVNKAVHARHERLMRAIDGEEPQSGAESAQPTVIAASGGLPEEKVPMGAPAPSPSGPMGVDLEGVTQRIPFPDPSQRTSQSKNMPPPMPAASPQQPPPSSPSTPISSVEGVSVEVYEKIRERVRQESVAQIRHELEVEFAHERQAIEKRAETFGSEVTMLLHDLIGKISEMGDDPTGLTSTVAATVHELNATVNRFREPRNR